MVSYQSCTQPRKSEHDQNGWYVSSATVSAHSNRREYYFFLTKGNVNSKAGLSIGCNDGLDKLCMDFMTRATDIIPFMVFYRFHEVKLPQGATKWGAKYLGKNTVSFRNREILREYYDDMAFYDRLRN